MKINVIFEQDANDFVEIKELPARTRKSNGHKAIVLKQKKSGLTLFSYEHLIMTISPTGNITVNQEYFDYSNTTRRHENDFIAYAKDLGYLNKNVNAADLLAEISKTICPKALQS